MERKDWMSILAKAPAAALAEAWRGFGRAPEFTWVRTPESGTVMVRGRTGGTGAPFNVGEMMVTRCCLRLAAGAVGHAYVQGRDKEKARVAAMVDALMQTDAAGVVREVILDPLGGAATEARRARACKAAATRVDFFTLVRGRN